ncbi:MAG: cyclic dehypoxanthinyl futalosine synthase [Desulfovibrionaceae bacterium]
MSANHPARFRAILDRAEDGGRIGFDQALDLYEAAPLHDLAAAADAVRRRKHPEGVVTFVSDRNINYSNICVCGCKFCAFYRAPGETGGYVLSWEELGRKIDETKALGGTQVLLQGGHHPELRLDFYEDMLRFIKDRGVHAHAFSPPEIVFFAELEGVSTREVLKRLINAGLDSIPGGGAEILVDDVRAKASPNKCGAEAWLNVMREAHQEGLRTTATMMFGHLETPAQRLLHLFKLRELQDETGGFTAFIPWAFQPGNTAITAPKATSPQYLRLLALSRLVLDNVDNLQVSWVTMGPKIGQLALYFGGNDFGSTMIEENVVKSAGVSFRLDAAEIRRLITAAGFAPAQRRMDYSLLPGEPRQ